MSLCSALDRVRRINAKARADARRFRVYGLTQKGFRMAKYVMSTDDKAEANTWCDAMIRRNTFRHYVVVDMQPPAPAPVVDMSWVELAAR